MKKETVKKYENFLEVCWKKLIISDVRLLAKDHNVSVTFTNWLIKNRYLVKLAGGSYKYLGSNEKRDVIVYMYIYRNEPKQPKPYPEPPKLTPLKEHEAEVIKLLKEIESDHGVSYELTRTETIKTKLL